MEDITLDYEEYSKQRLKEYENDPGSLMITIAVPDVSIEQMLGKEPVSSVVTVKSGKDGSNQFTRALAVAYLKDIVRDFEKDPMIEMLSEMLKSAARDAGSVKIDLNKGEVTHDTDFSS